MPVEVVCTIIAAAGALLSAVLSFFVSRFSAAREMERLHKTWEREDVVSSNDEFAVMASAVAEFVHSGSGLFQRKAMATVAFVRARERGALADRLDALYAAVFAGSGTQANDELTKVIEEKRQRQG